MVDVLVFTVFFIDNIFDHDAVGSVYLLQIADNERRVGRHDFYVEAGFFFDFSEGGLNRIFVGIDMSAGRQPFLHFLVPVEQGGIVVDDEAGSCEVPGFRSWHFRSQSEEVVDGNVIVVSG